MEGGGAGVVVREAAGVRVLGVVVVLVVVVAC